MDYQLMIDSIPRLLEGAKMTVKLSVLGIVFGVLAGLGIALIRSRRSRNPIHFVLYVLATGYVELVRGTPFMVQLMLVNYGPPLFFQMNIPEFAAAIIAITINSGAYVSEIFRAGIQSIDKGQMEAARSLGLTPGQAMRLVILPQAFKRVLPPLGNEFIMLIKESSLVSVIGVSELTWAGKKIGAATYKPFEPLAMVTLFYLVMTLIAGRGVSFLERRLKAGD